MIAVTRSAPWALRERIVGAAASRRAEMPRVRRKDLPPAHVQHLLDRIQQRQIEARQLELLAPA